MNMRNQHTLETRVKGNKNFLCYPMYKYFVRSTYQSDNNMTNSFSHFTKQLLHHIMVTQGAEPITIRYTMPIKFMSIRLFNSV